MGNYKSLLAGLLLPVFFLVGCGGDGGGRGLGSGRFGSSKKSSAGSEASGAGSGGELLRLLGKATKLSLIHI